ncbi:MULTISPECIES: DUF5665 domain-containing protein [Dethiosulfovibrio]|jgi:hypothetical protein|uniref:DUF5665 domain-containing protein n=2 Tax=Dethiosulfovibrio TaxID=47054 RepID=A0ABS9ESQ6_9BACT|nr:MULTISPECIES: DUF5665 domain-containing protein [Dethiosulfovibrio]MCF4114517.1 DUF5665 domain-containing protein [Dethiosulfovibrio russensis]MCF4143501.1 DUF5665 domain-containing protein [Dethiosulfovibrio marinus]MCF4146147.1 DUF5665 domain-containing protein [Dethiosulfovibrio acidaminovorans]MEA3285542.1 DUF5665 domain-containing protein [Synergistota bacterium]
MKYGRFLWVSFLGGIARGVGFALGLTVVAAALLWGLVGFLKTVVDWNLPFVGKYVAQFLQVVNDQMHLLQNGVR